MNRRRSSPQKTLTETSIRTAIPLTAAIAFSLAPGVRGNTLVPVAPLESEFANLSASPNAAQSSLEISQQVIDGSRWIEPNLWLHSIRQNIGELLDLSDNWDSYGAVAIRPEFAASALGLLQSIMDSETLVPSVVPTNLGGIQIEWHAKGIDLEIEVESTSRISVWYEDDRTGVSWEEELSSDLSKLADAMATLRLQAAERQV
ncbi:MAG: hypothetical protein ACREQH_08385 [Candidatus Binatus sp.]